MKMHARQNSMATKRSRTMRDMNSCYLTATFLLFWSIGITFAPFLPYNLIVSAVALIIAATRFLNCVIVYDNVVSIQSFSFRRGVTRQSIAKNVISHCDVFPQQYPAARTSIFIVLNSGVKIRTPLLVSIMPNANMHFPPSEFTRFLPRVQKLNSALGDC